MGVVKPRGCGSLLGSWVLYCVAASADVMTAPIRCLTRTLLSSLRITVHIRKRRLAEDIVVDGAKRGNGRRKRQRKLKAALKQEETRKRVKEREEARSKTKSS